MKAWTQESFSHEGKFWKYKDISLWPGPISSRIRRSGFR